MDKTSPPFSTIQVGAYQPIMLLYYGELSTLWTVWQQKVHFNYQFMMQ